MGWKGGCGVRGGGRRGVGWVGGVLDGWEGWWGCQGHRLLQEHGVPKSPCLNLWFSVFDVLVSNIYVGMDGCDVRGGFGECWNNLLICCSELWYGRLCRDSKSV